jgi:hypothetical protein
MTIAVFVELLFAIAQLIAAASFICDQLPVKKVGVACCHDFGRAYTARRFGGSDAREDNEWMFTAQRPQQRVRQSVSSTARPAQATGTATVVGGEENDPVLFYHQGQVSRGCVMRCDYGVERDTYLVRRHVVGGGTEIVEVRDRAMLVY